MKVEKWLAPRLKFRIELLKAVQTANAVGGFDRTYETLSTLWAGIKQLDTYSAFARFVRGVQTDDATETHEFIIRFNSVSYILGKEYSTSFDDGYNTFADLNPVKSDYFIKIIEGNSEVEKGRLYRIERLRRDENFKSYLKIRTYEVDEQGVGYPA